MVSRNPDPPAPSEDPQARRQLAAQLAVAAMIMGGFDSDSDKEKVEKMPLMPRFSLGRTYATAAVTRWAEHEKIDLADYLRRHHCGDWGDLCDDDKQANEDALIYGGRIFSSYLTGDRKIFAITEADRSMTTILFAEEY